MASVTRFIRGHFSPCNEVDQFGLTVLHLRQEFFCLQLSLYPTYKVTKNLGRYDVMKACLGQSARRVNLENF